MEHINSTIKMNQKTALAVGKFDTLHKGHQTLICEMIKRAAMLSLRTVVLSFYPTPAVILHNLKPMYVFTSAEKMKILSSPPFDGLDYFIEYPFDKAFSKMPPEAFINDILYEKFNCGLLAAGQGYRFGKDRCGNVDTVKAAGGIECLEIKDVLLDKEFISSSKIRELITAGNFNKAAEFMGRPYSIGGIVSKGKKLGSKLGFPTANIEIEKDKFTPANGVYITKIIIDNLSFPGVSNLGINPSFGGDIKKCETYIIGGSLDLYGKYITVCFYSRIRKEMVFKSVEALKDRISDDVKTARQYWGI